MSAKTDIIIRGGGMRKELGGNLNPSSMPLLSGEW